MGSTEECSNITEVFPSAFHHVISHTKSSRNGFIGEVRANLKTKRDITSWIKTFEKNTNTKLIATNVSKCGKQSSKFAVEMNYVCTFNKNKTDKMVSKKKCPAFVNLSVIKESKSSRDDYVKQGLFGVIKINFAHNHGVNSTRMLRSSNGVVSSLQSYKKEIDQDKGKATKNGYIQHESQKKKISRDSLNKCNNTPTCAYCDVNGKQHSKRRLFSFPRDAKKCKKWVEACQDSVLMQKPISKLKNLKMCSAHFIDSDYVGSSKMRLKSNACPSLFTKKRSQGKKVPRENSSENKKAMKAKKIQRESYGGKLKRVDPCYEGFASYDSSSEESSDYDEVPLDIPFGFEKDNTDFKKSQTLTSDFPRRIYSGEAAQRPRAVEFQIRFVCSQNCSNH